MKIYSFSAYAILFLFLSVSSFQIVHAQSVDFRVLVQDQGVEIKQGDTWISMQTGATLQSGDLIRLKEGAYLGLVHQNGQTLELSKAGTYEVNRLSEKMDNTTRSLSSKYASLLVDRQLNGQSPVMQLERSLEASKLKILLPNSVDVFNDEVIIRWKSDEEMKSSYVLKFKNMFDEVIHTTEVEDTRAIVDFDKEALSEQKLLIVTVSSKTYKDLQSADYGMKQLSPEEAAPIARELRELRLEINEEQSALDKLILASFYEQNNLLADALTNYEYAISLAPDNDAYQTAYEQFLFRNGLDY
jgi:hypothetical protein